MGNLFHPSRAREGQRDLIAKRPSRSGVGLRGLSHPHPHPLPQAGGES